MSQEPLRPRALWIILEIRSASSKSVHGTLPGCPGALLSHRGLRPLPGAHPTPVPGFVNKSVLQATALISGEAEEGCLRCQQLCCCAPGSAVRLKVTYGTGGILPPGTTVLGCSCLAILPTSLEDTQGQQRVMCCSPAPRESFLEILQQIFQVLIKVAKKKCLYRGQLIPTLVSRCP